MTNANKSVQIPCPKCGRELKLPDRSLLGRKGKCPKCSHTFILEEPPTVTLELAASDSVVQQTPLSQQKIPPAPSFVTKPTAVRAEPAATHPESAVPSFDFTPEFAGIEQLAEPIARATGLRHLQKRSARNRNIALAVGAVILLAVGGVVVTTKLSVRASPRASHDQGLIEQAESGATVNGEPIEIEVDPSATPYAKLGNPTKGKPIDLQYIPFGTQIVLNLHPAELWKPSSLGEELRYCAPPLARLIETTLTDVFKRKPEEVEELLICLIPGERGTLPDIAAVAHMLEEQKRSQLIDQFGQRIDSFAQPYYVSGNRAYLIPDQKTLVAGPKSQIEEMIQAAKDRHPAAQIDPLLPLTDRKRQFTVILTPETLGLQDSWYPENVRPFVRNAIDWLGDEVETLAWSFQLTDDLFYSDLVIRHRGVSAKRYEQDFKTKLAGLAEHLVPIIRQMNPRESGKRMIIGRLPAMVEVFSLATISSHGSQHVQYITPLPDRAAPNLVLGTVLAWDESTRTDFSNVKPVAPTEGSAVPAMVADRLNMKIEVDFRAAPFNEAFAYIGGEIKTPIDIDGDSLKTGGFTKNIKQEFKMESARALDVIMRIFENSRGVDVNPEKNLVLIIDETKKRILVTTSAGAQRKGMTPFEIKK